eukprot:gene1166-2266_t
MHSRIFLITVFILVAARIFSSDDINISEVSLPEKPLRVAVITSGAIRSFAFVEKSWRRYLLEPWSGSVFIFAHIIASKRCPIATRGVALLQDIAEEVEVLWSSAPLVTQKKIERFLPAAFKKVNQHKGVGHGLSHGNIFDMWARRTRAYHMAVAYAERKEVPWDLIIMVRLDTGFYSPTLQLHQWHHSLMNYRNEKGHDGILIPSSCNFDGVCDRFAAGLPAAMDIYFREDWIFDALAWSLEPSANKTIAEYQATILEDYDFYWRFGSEKCLKLWFLMNNITDVYPSDKNMSPLTFVTVRTGVGNAYCSRTRDTYAYGYVPVHWTDVMTAYSEYGREPSDFDLVASPYGRCGSQYTLNATELCMRKDCNCGAHGR